MGNKRGFSAVEISMTLVIIGIFSVLTVPSFIGFTVKARLKGAVREIHSDIMNTKMSAVSQNANFKILFVNDHQYIIAKDINNNGEYETNEYIATKNIDNLFSGISVTTEQDPEFYPRGTVSSSEIVISNSETSKKISINVAGKVKVTSL
jgi:type IV fimbrial biogenesis protein FimT